MARCLDEWSGRPFKSNINKIAVAVAELNESILSDGEMMVNDLYDLLGLDPNASGHHLGWTEPLTVKFTPMLDKKGRPILAFSFVETPNNNARLRQ